jgi:rubredoxin
MDEPIDELALARARRARDARRVAVAEEFRDLFSPEWAADMAARYPNGGGRARLMRCLACGHDYQSEHPAAADPTTLECPRCKATRSEVLAELATV